MRLVILKRRTSPSSCNASQMPHFLVYDYAEGASNCTLQQTAIHLQGRPCNVWCFSCLTPWSVNHSWAPYQRKVGPFLIRVPRIFFFGVHFSSPKKLTTFFNRQRTSTQRGKKIGSWSGPAGGGVQPAQWIIRPCLTQVCHGLDAWLTASRWCQLAWQEGGALVCGLRVGMRRTTTSMRNLSSGGATNDGHLQASFWLISQRSRPMRSRVTK